MPLGNPPSSVVLPHTQFMLLGFTIPVLSRFFFWLECIIAYGFERLLTSLMNSDDSCAKHMCPCAVVVDSLMFYMLISPEIIQPSVFQAQKPNCGDIHSLSGTGFQVNHCDI
jgi:hypothetical protein